jgi:hypothetical protein
VPPDDLVGEILSSHDDEPPYDGSAVASPRRRRTGVVLGSAALALTLVAAAGVYTAGQLSGGGAQPESVLPGSTFAMVKVDLEPGGDQKAAIREFARRFPASGIPDVAGLRDKLVRSMTESWGLDYATGVRPWLGRRAALAAFEGADGKPHTVAVLQVTDAQGAKTALGKAEDETFVAERGGYLVVAQDQRSLDLAIAAAEDGSLADADEFSSDLAALDGDQVAVAWVDNRRAVDAMSIEFRDMAEGMDDGFLDRQMKQLEAAAHGRIVLGLHATSTYVELQGIASGDSRKPATGRPDDLRRLPDTTIGALYVRDPKGLSATGLGGFDLPARTIGPFGFGVMPAYLFGGHEETGFGPSEPMPPPVPCPTQSGGDDAVVYCFDNYPCPEGEDCFRPPPISPECQKQMEQWASGDMDAPPPPCVRVRPPSPAKAKPSPSGRALTSSLLGDDTDDDDLGQVFGELMEAMFPAVQDDLMPVLRGDTTVALGSLPAPGTGRAPDMALVADVSDERAAAEFADGFKAAFSKQFAEEPSCDVKDGRLVLASDAAYRDRLGTDGLGESALFKTAMGELGDQVQLAAFANLERVRDAVPGYPDELRPVSAVGMSLGQHDGHGYLRLRVVSR